MQKKIALITGVTGQDGSLLARLLLNKGYVVHGVKRRSSSFNTSRIDDIYPKAEEPDTNFNLHFGDMTDATNIIHIVQKTKPDEIYNLAAQSHVHVSFETPEYTANTDALGTLRLLEAVRILSMDKKTKIYQASTSELFGDTEIVPQNEQTPFSPSSPYAAAKLYAYWITVNYRKAYNLFASNGILFNHESPVRGETFVTRKITRAIAEIEYGLAPCMYLGNLNAMRDWGHAQDFVEGMWATLQHHEADDFVLATGETRSIREFVMAAFKYVGRNIAWRGEGLKEVGFDEKSGDILVRVDPHYFRPTDVGLLRGDYSKAKELLGWTPKIAFEEMVEEMVRDDIKWIADNKGLRQPTTRGYNSSGTA